MRSTRRRFGKWILRGGILVPFVVPRLVRAATIINPYRFAAAPSAYLLSENFEGTGYENSWTETGTVDEDYTTTVLAGSQSLNITALADGTVASITAQDDCWAYALIQFQGTPGANAVVFQFLNSSNADLCGLRYRTSGVVQCSPGFGSTPAVSNSTTYHFWLHYIKGTGSNSVGELYFSTTGVRPGSPNSTFTNGSGTTQASKIRCGGTSAGVIFDKIRVSASSIGDNPA